MTIKGHGFNSDTITTVIDGVECKLLESEMEYFKCQTGINPSPSNDTNYIGQHGLRRRYINSTTYPTLTNMTLYPKYNETLAIDLESP